MSQPTVRITQTAERSVTGRVDSGIETLVPESGASRDEQCSRLPVAAVRLTSLTQMVERVIVVMNSNYISVSRLA